MIKFPNDFISKGYKFEAEIPAPKLETERTPEGSFTIRARFESNAIEELAKKAAIEMTDKVEDAIMDELLRLNGYVPELTCTFSVKEKEGDPYPTCSECGYETDWHECEWCFDDTFEYKKNFCPNCGSKVIRNAD